MSRKTGFRPDAGVTMSIVLALGAVMFPAAACAQDPRGEVEQIGAATSAPVQQIGERSKRTDTPARSDSRTGNTVAQLSDEGDSEPDTSQLTSEKRATRVGQQLNTGGKTAQAPEALSRPSEGRTGAVARIGGADRCDAVDAQGRRAADCARAIETRSAEFVPPEETPLSPEQRLLVDQRLREAPASARTAARSLGNAGLKPDSLEEQGVASFALRATPAPSREEPSESEEALSSEAAALINAIVAAATNGEPR